MFVKPLVKYNKSTKQRYNVYQLCESFRFDGRIRHRVIVGLGKLDDLPTEAFSPNGRRTVNGTGQQPPAVRDR
jgi:hypothetical protein